MSDKADDKESKDKDPKDKDPKEGKKKEGLLEGMRKSIFGIEDKDNTKKPKGWLAGFRQELFDRAQEREEKAAKEAAKKQKQAEEQRKRGTLKKAAKFLYNLTSGLPGLKGFYKALLGRKTADTYYVKPFRPGPVNPQSGSNIDASKPTTSNAAHEEAERQRRALDASSNKGPNLKTPPNPSIVKGKGNIRAR